MKDQLEDFIRQNRAAFDAKEPSDKNWDRIQKKLFGSTSLWNTVGVWRAAAIVLLGACVYLAIPKIQDRKESAMVLSEFKDIETFYISQIANKVEQIEDYRGEEEGLNGFTHDFAQLEAMYQVLKEEMRVHPSQKVKDALVLNLLVRIDLLNQQLHKIEQSEASEKEKDPMSNT
ncbi:MAG: hypothetical protein JNK18_02035 [Cyclobacteriaceae bacterium]|nr:hypothetical protein [Cyclobacteriaceae bacterium]